MVTGASFQPLGYAGGIADTLTGLVRFGARDYDAAVGRWTCKDPIDFESDEVNLYAYASNNPVNLRDPNGLDVIIEIDRDSYSPTAIRGGVTAKSDRPGTGTFVGTSLEPTAAVKKPPKDPVPPGTYDAFVRAGHSPPRIQLRNVPGYSGIELHPGISIGNSLGCFLISSTKEPRTWPESRKAMEQILKIIKEDGTGKIRVKVKGSATQPQE